MVQHGKYLESELREKKKKQNTCQLMAENKPNLWDEVLDPGVKIAKWLLEMAGDIINATMILFSGSSTSERDDGAPLTCKIEGKLVGDDTDIDRSWKPDLTLSNFIKAIFNELWEMIKEAVSKFFEGLAKIAQEVVEEVVKLAEDVGEAVAEGGEKAAEAIEDAASDVGHAVEDVAEDIRMLPVTWGAPLRM